MTKPLLVLILATAVCAGQPAPPGARPPHPPKPPDNDPRTIERRIGEIQTRLAATPPAGPEQTELAEYVRQYLSDAEGNLERGRTWQARCLADAADACRRPIDHLRAIRLQESARGPAPPGPEDALRRVWFRLRLADWLLTQIPPPAPKRLLDLARDFYERAVRAREQRAPFASGEYAKAADDLTHALENLAQAAAGDRTAGGRTP